MGEFAPCAARHRRCALAPGVRARVLDTRLVWRAAASECVLRERSWREGAWTALVGTGAASHVDFGGQCATLAAQRLPLLRDPLTEELRLPEVAVPAEEAAAMPLCWKRRVSCEALTVSGGIGALVLTNGEVEAFDPATGHVLWRRVDDGGGGGNAAEVLSIALSPAASAARLLALGDASGTLHVWRAGDGEPIGRFEVKPSALPCGWSAEGRWMERLAWSSDGRRVAAAAGRAVLLVQLELDGDVGEDGRALVEEGQAGQEQENESGGCRTGLAVANATGGGTVYGL
eukprot:SAG11_NODE_1939_length_4028_cov_1.658946_1_plen_287_part_10